VLNDVGVQRFGIAVGEPAQIIRVGDKRRLVVTDVVDQSLQPLQTVQATLDGGPGVALGGQALRSKGQLIMEAGRGELRICRV
jgi:hypothetical protein